MGGRSPRQPKKITPEMLAASGREHGQQAALFCWMVEYQKIYPRIRYAFAIPNGGLRDRITASRLRAEGVKSGVPDIFLPIPSAGYHGLFLEMKRTKGGVVSAEQEDYHIFLMKAGYCLVICHSFEEARDAILAYIAHT